MILPVKAVQLGLRRALCLAAVRSRPRRAGLMAPLATATRSSNQRGERACSESPPVPLKAGFEIPILQQFPISTIDTLLFQIICLFAARKCYPCFFLKANPFCSSLKRVRAHKVCHHMTVLSRWQPSYQSMTDHRTSGSISKVVSGVDWRGRINKASRRSRQVSREAVRGWRVSTNSLVFPHVGGARQERASSAVKSISFGSELIGRVWSPARGSGTAAAPGRRRVRAAHVRPRVPEVGMSVGSRAGRAHAVQQEAFRGWRWRSRARPAVRQLAAPVHLEVVKQPRCVHQLPIQPHVPNERGTCRHGQSIGVTWVITETATRITARRRGQLEICGSISMKAHERSLSSSTDKKLSQELKKGGKNF